MKHLELQKKTIEPNLKNRVSKRIDSFLVGLGKFFSDPRGFHINVCSSNIFEISHLGLAFHIIFLAILCIVHAFSIFLAFVSFCSYKVGR